ncbi:DUF4032 domain-containing protein [Leptotrichia sp. oral taxon 212]|uniref:DUF4032 domain-containing protein n=1 Tax=Leptotrichia sp. oral taxon 212 TaxID=712357 RepID=UPI0006A9655D|nr:DUF4032 domain-containing protein [Leptotrichia sp. oral taxon 212]ALA96150.1 hypothetical protein AMK43_09140 [Leptotrichia sp. oral taxon 212]
MDNRNTIYFSEAQAAYRKFLKSSRGMLGLNFKKKENLKSFTEIQKEENAYNSVNLGIKEIPLDKIVGSVEKYSYFDKNFVPKNDIVKQRWINIYVGYMMDSMLPPVILYKIKDDYYVYDGNHRVSVAKFLNFASIEAEVEEFLPTKDTKDKVIYQEHMFFEKETGIEEIILSEPIKYKYLREEIESYTDLLNKRRNRNFSLREGAEKWYKEVFLPIKGLLEENNIAKSQKKNISDIFMFLLDHKYYLSKNEGKNKGYLYSTIDFINLVKTNENRNLHDMCQIETQEAVEKYRKLAALDEELIDLSFREKKEKKELLKKEISEYFSEALEKLPVRYSEYLAGIESSKDIFSGYILEYIEILNKGKNLEILNIQREEQESSEKIENCDFHSENRILVLNYILEVFLPITEILIWINEENIFSPEEYESLQREFFYLLRLKKILLSEGKSAKYENIMAENIKIAVETKNRDMLCGVKNILVKEKEKEFIRNLENAEKFYSLLQKYGEIKRYETYTDFFIMLDNYGEKRFMDSLEKDLEEFYSFDEIVNEYKTQAMLYMENNTILKNGYENNLQENYEYGFIDFFIMKNLGEI